MLAGCHTTLLQRESVAGDAGRLTYQTTAARTVNGDVRCFAVGLPEADWMEGRHVMIMNI